MSQPAIVRVAPSPTGDPHVGTAYMALFNYLLARKTQGRFILRIEDTDQTRYDANSERHIMETLSWLGLTWDEGPDKGGPNGPYRQSERTTIYRRHMDLLLESGKAYRCFCTEERLQELRLAQRARKEPPGYDGLCRGLLPEDVDARLTAGTAFVVRLRVPKDRTVEFRDELRDVVRIEGSTIDDQVLLKSDGYPTYHLANVVDDHLMGVTDVIRAEEWIVSTPKHILLYEAFGWSPPRWRHMPLLRNKDRSKISKRKNPTSLNWYRAHGFLPEALLNFLALMGYSLPDGREVFDLDYLLETFDPSRISTTSPVFDLEKLTWLNGEYIRALPPDSLLQRLLSYFRFRRDALPAAEHGSDADVFSFADAHGGFQSSEVVDQIQCTLPLVQERIKTLAEYAGLARCFFVREVDSYPGQELLPKTREAAEVLDVLGLLEERLTLLGDWSAPALEGVLRDLGEEIQWKPKDLFVPVRVAVTGSRVSPPLFESMDLIGRERCLERIRHARTVLGG
jgi:glutamyl-tRNA synthetase